MTTTIAFAQRADQDDPMKHFREEFLIPQHAGKDAIYLCGNSLGLQPKRVEHDIKEHLSDWATLGVDGHFAGERPWLKSHEPSKAALQDLLGAKRHEVVSMNFLTVNLHLMMASFYRPEGNRTKIMIEKGAFPSDRYAAVSHLASKGFGEEHLIEVAPRAGENTLRTADILDQIKAQGDTLALLLFPGIQYYTGQLFDMKTLTAAGHEAGALVGWDCAHAFGNAPMSMHEWGADFATWCTYKYGNSGPGGISGVFVHEKHGKNYEGKRLTGWWGTLEKERFQMLPDFEGEPGVDGWIQSNSPALLMTSLQASLDIFTEAGFKNLRAKSVKLTAYLEFLLQELLPEKVEIITPSHPDERGCQLSLVVGKNGKAAFEHLSANGVICDWREPSVIRIAPTPLYNTFEEVFHFVRILKEGL